MGGRGDREGGGDEGEEEGLRGGERGDGGGRGDEGMGDGGGGKGGRGDRWKGTLSVAMESSGQLSGPICCFTCVTRRASEGSE